ncbi:MAG: LCP family protein [Thermomicrobiales bacterium]|nr:LCP family protein [Thermomicrobiales bacterium]
MADLSSNSRQDYPGLARERAKRRGAATAHESRPSPSQPYPRARTNRYETLTAAAAAPAGESAAPARSRRQGESRANGTRRARRYIPDGVSDGQPLPVSLRDEFARVRGDQSQHQSRTRRMPISKPKRPIRFALLSSSAVILFLVAVLVGPTIYQAMVARDKIFVENVPHDDSPFVVAVGPEGTRTIVTPTPAGEGEQTGQSAIADWNGEERLTILLLGVDRREDEASRSDTMILVNIDPVTKRAAMLSIPRDLKVIIPGYGVQKINAAYAFGDADEVPGGGPGLVIRTIEANFGITVHHYAQVDFEGFVKIIDTLGGLTLDVPYPIKDDEYPGPGNQYMRIYFQAGWQHMDGDRVLQYARTRHDDGDGRRSARQQQVLMALRDQAVSLDLLSKATELLIALGDAVRTDLDDGQALQLARLGTEIDPSAIIQFSLDDAVYEEQLEGQPYFLVPDWTMVGEILSEFTGSEVLPPMSALGNPNYDIEIVIEDGTYNPGLGDRVAQVLMANGFGNVIVTEKPDLGNYPVSSVAADTGNLTTAFLVAGVLGLDLSAISVFDSDETGTVPSSSSTTSAGSDAASPGGEVDAVPLFPTPMGGASSGQPSGTIVIVIGDDAPDPAYFTSEPFVDEPSFDEGGGSYDESIEGGGDETGAVEDEIPTE